MVARALILKGEIFAFVLITLFHYVATVTLVGALVLCGSN
jgi:hypothetical protein